jgi:alkylation response protein AidB-like acyl-CoA dehydrogenase
VSSAVSRLESFLGDPFVAGSHLSFASTVAREESEAPLTDDLDVLRKFGFHRHFVPRALGGELDSWEGAMDLVRAVARRDPTLVIAFGTGVLGANPVWMWGSERQRSRLARLMLQGALGAFAMSEAAHGSDLAASEVTATRRGDELVLDGTKWPIGNARAGELLTIFARTSPGTARAFSLVFVTKGDLDRARHEVLPPVKTLGARGHDLSGIRFREAPIDRAAVVGRQGMGLEYTLMALQLTRTMIAGLSLGAADSALRIATQWARPRRLYGAAASDIAAVRELLVGAWVDLLVGEVVARAAARALTLVPERAALWSSIAKYFVPVTCESIFRDTAVVLGARHYLREGVADGVFQKLARDHAIASVFEGTTLVNLDFIAGELAPIAERACRKEAQRETDDDALVERLFGPAEAPPWTPSDARLALSNRGHDEIVSGLSRRRGECADVDGWCSARDALYADVRRALDEGGPLRRAPGGFDLARRYCVLFAAACCVHAVVHGRHDRAWLGAALARLADRPPSRAQHDAMWRRLSTAADSGDWMVP